MANPLQREKQNSWSTLSSIKCQLNKVKILPSERVFRNQHTWARERRHPAGPLRHGANWEMKRHVLCSYWHAEAHCRFCLLQHLLGELWEHTPGFVGYNDHRSCTLLSTGRKKCIHPVLPEATPGAELWLWVTFEFCSLKFYFVFTLEFLCGLIPSKPIPLECSPVFQEHLGDFHKSIHFQNYSKNLGFFTEN